MSEPILVCNICQCGVDGIAFRTTCRHFYCPPCAKSTFGNSCKCAICCTRLTDTDVVETTIGIAISEESIAACLFQAVLQTTSFAQMNQRLQRISMGVNELHGFVLTQVQHSATQSLAVKERMEDTSDMHAQQMQVMNDRLRDMETSLEESRSSYEHQLRDSNRALCELQEQYKEKVRKCQAWEKAYNNIRSQITGGNRAPLLDAGEPASHSVDMPPTGRSEVTTFRNVTSHHLTHTFPLPFTAAVPYGNGSNGGPFPAVSPALRRSPAESPYPPMQPSHQRRNFLTAAASGHLAPQGSSYTSPTLAAKPSSLHGGEVPKVASSYFGQPPAAITARAPPAGSFSSSSSHSGFAGGTTVGGRRERGATGKAVGGKRPFFDGT